jgi:hypothetical protein
MLKLPIASATLLAVLLGTAPGCTSPAEDRPADEKKTDGKSLSEKEKIEALIKHVEGMQGAVFVRNGKEYDAKTAGKFLRGKWERDSDVKTARDFIEKIATTSSTSGKPYLIRFKDGKEVKSGEYLTEELKKLEKGSGDAGKA